MGQKRPSNGPVGKTKDKKRWLWIAVCAQVTVLLLLQTRRTIEIVKLLLGVAGEDRVIVSFPLPLASW